MIINQYYKHHINRMQIIKRNQNHYNFTYNHLNFVSTLTKYKYHLNLGDITAGTIFSKEKEGFLIDIGAKIVGYLPKDEISINKYHSTPPIINDTREFFILAYNKNSQQLILSIKRLEYIRAWQRIKQMQKEDISIQLPVQKINKGGIITSIEGMQAFIPKSHLNNLEITSSLIKKQILCQFLIVNEKHNQIIFSHKRAILKSLEKIIYVGQVTTGTISKIESYGIFIEIYNLIALLHISEISDKKINPKYLFNVGNQITVKIMHIDQKQGRVSVSCKNLN